MKVTKWNVASNLLRQWALGRHHCKAQSPYLCSQLFAGHKLCKVLLHAHIIDNTFSQLQSVQNCNPHKLIDISPKLNTDELQPIKNSDTHSDYGSSQSMTFNRFLNYKMPRE